jgi:hypothetical protein
MDGQKVHMKGIIPKEQLPMLWSWINGMLGLKPLQIGQRRGTQGTSVLKEKTTASCKGSFRLCASMRLWETCLQM